MRYSLLKLSFFVVLMLLLDGCIQPFSPPEVNSPDTFLVIDGFLNTGQDTSKIELRRTQNTNETAAPLIETGAVVSVESETGETYNFSEISKGAYILPPYPFNQSVRYRLRVKTKAAKEYLSDYVIVSQTPPIDSITYKVDPNLDAMVFYINAHDPKNNTRFYRWKFEESWQYDTQQYSSLEVIGTGANKEVVVRKQNISRCYSIINSSNIILGSTIRLSQDIIKNLPINTVPISSNKLIVKYSIQVKQYGLSKEAFEYWTDLAKTTQGTGSLFDPLPSQVTGNIKNTADPKELVFGFFNAVVEQKKRIFISPRLGRLPFCKVDTIPVECLPRRETDCAYETAGLLIYYADPRQQSVLVTDADCADCRLHGGTLTKPWFWD